MYNNIVRSSTERTSMPVWVFCGSIVGPFITIPAYFHNRALDELAGAR